MQKIFNYLSEHDIQKALAQVLLNNCTLKKSISSYLVLTVIKVRVRVMVMVRIRIRIRVSITLSA